MKKFKILLVILLILAPLVCGFVLYEESAKVEITYELYGGENSPQNKNEYSKTDGVIILSDPTREGYDFLGWYLSSDFSEDSRVTEIDCSKCGDIVLYAKFIQVMEITPSGIVLFLTDYGKTKTEIVLPRSTVEVSANAFKGATSLKKLDASNCAKLKSIKMMAFEDCKNLEEVLLPACVENIEGRAFDYRTISALKFPSGSDHYAVESGSLVNKTTKTLAIGGVAGRIPGGVETIGDYSFAMNKDVKSVEIPRSVSKVGSHAFANCHNLEELKIEGSSRLEVVGKYAFAYCYNLKEIILPNGVKTIGNGAFANCRSIEEIVFPSSVQMKIMGNSILYGCEKLKSFVIPDGIEEIEGDAFANCISLTEIIIPECVKVIDGDAFRDSYNLQKAELKGTGSWRVKPFMKQGFSIDQSLFNDSSKFAEILCSNYIGSTYLGNAYARFTLLRG